MEDDPVVKEIPVFLSKTLGDNLFLLQYTTYPMKDGYEIATVLKSSIKPDNQEIQLELEVDIDNSNYDSSKGVQLALNAKNESKKNENIFDSDLLDKTILSSKRALTDCSNYAIGIFQKNELHITPLEGFVEMQPQFPYLEKSDKRAKDEAKASGEDSDEEEENAAPVKVTFARHKPDHIKKIQEQSFQHNSKKNQQECCIRTTYVAMHETPAQLTQTEMLCPSPDVTVNSLNLSPQEYLELLTNGWRKPQNYPQSFEHVKTLLLQEQITSIMKDARIMSYKNLRAILPPEHTTTDVLSYLQKTAVLVRGNWVVKSELIYPKDFTSSENGIPGELMCKARDYVLLCFTDHSYIKRDKVLSIVKLPLAEVTEIFEKLAVKDGSEGWKLILSPDWEFCDRYPELVERQQMFWEATRKYLRESHVQPRQRRKSNRESLGSENEERNVGRGRKSHRDSSLSDNDGATEPVTKPKKTNRSRKNSETTNI
ncbi:DNA-directed RNA polymerase III subunit RPC5 [Harpegnathos saltator]|uniref:DNA-directed RNA polymerase III subunit RPC5 n=1 Tax=Harpegnathos saltator TaxID=610380 RepID=E2BQI0_HARSA|nr:DNA-directed RNA polymerase III subunit RPC5 [Harpegnathos saltator]EFN82038.1 DNA-directed RNA polymerase III subunit RPC5 [Harpegnathos saltator]